MCQLIEIDGTFSEQERKSRIDKIFYECERCHYSNSKGGRCLACGHKMTEISQSKDTSIFEPRGHINVFK